MLDFCILSVCCGMAFWTGIEYGQYKSVDKEIELKDFIFKLELENKIKETMKEKGIDYI